MDIKAFAVLHAWQRNILRHSFVIWRHCISCACVVFLLPSANQPVPDKQIQCKDVRMSFQTFDVALDAPCG